MAGNQEKQPSNTLLSDITSDSDKIKIIEVKPLVSKQPIENDKSQTSQGKILSFEALFSKEKTQIKLDKEGSSDIHSDQTPSAQENIIAHSSKVSDECDSQVLEFDLNKQMLAQRRRAVSARRKAPARSKIVSVPDKPHLPAQKGIEGVVETCIGVPPQNENRIHQTQVQDIKTNDLNKKSVKIVKSSIVKELEKLNSQMEFKNDELSLAGIEESDDKFDNKSKIVITNTSNEYEISDSARITQEERDLLITSSESITLEKDIKLRTGDSENSELETGNTFQEFQTDDISLTIKQEIESNLGTAPAVQAQQISVLGDEPSVRNTSECQKTSPNAEMLFSGEPNPGRVNPWPGRFAYFEKTFINPQVQKVISQIVESDIAKFNGKFLNNDVRVVTYAGI